MQIQLSKRQVYLIIGGIFAALLLCVPMVARAQGFDCGGFGPGWEPAWFDGVPDCTYMGVYDNGCCYRADGTDRLAAIVLGLIPACALLIGIAGAMGWIGGERRLQAFR